MRRRISSKATSLLKAISCLWIGLFLAVTLSLFYAKSTGSRVPLSLLLIFVAATIAGTVIMLRYCLPCRDVAIEGDSLVIRSLHRSAVVSFSEIEAIRQNRWLSTRQVTVYFRQPTPFGRSVIFMPQLVDWWVKFPATEHPIVKELCAAAGLNVRG
jgi:hypothetical protein